MENNLQDQVNKLTQELETLKRLFYKDSYSDLEVFRKQVQFKANVDMGNINTITKTGGTDPIGDGGHTVSIPVGGGSVTITTKNGIITNIS